MSKKTWALGGLVAAAMAAGGIAVAQPFGPGHGHGGGRHAMHAGADQGAARGHGHGGGHGSGQRMRHGGDHAQGERQDRGRGMGMGRGPGMGMGRGMMGMGAAGPDAATAGEMRDIHTLFAEHRGIRRSVTNLPNGIRTVTESDDPRLADVIRTHVAEMGQRVEDGRNPRLPIQSAELNFLFEARDRIASTYETTEHGIIVVQTSDDAAVVAALQRHAAEVSDLAERGMVAAREAMMRNGGMMRRAQR